jgi:hypothetical protein
MIELMFSGSRERCFSSAPDPTIKSSVGTYLVVEYCHVRSKVPSVDRDVEWPYLGEGLVSHNSTARRRLACPSRERLDGL